MTYEQKQKFYYRQYIANLFDEKTFKSSEMEDFINYFRENRANSISEIIYKSFGLNIFENILSKKLGDLENDRALKNIGTFTKLVSDFEEIFAKVQNCELEFIYGYLFYFYKKNAVKEFDENTKDYDAINFMTIHNSKGLEFDVVFVSGLNDYPRANQEKLLEKYEYAKSDKDSTDKDFYRKYYTAFTRAKNLLVLLDNSRDYRLVDFSKKLDDSSKLSTINFKKKEKIIEKPILAFTTDIEVYDSCPLKYKFIRRLNYKIPKSSSLVLGSKIHDLAEYVGTNKDLDVGKLKEILEKNPDFISPLNNFTNRDFEISQSEVNYKADRDFYILQGNIDLALKDGSIMDLKTGDYDEIILEKYQKQLLTYKYLMELNNNPAGDLLLYFIQKDELIKVENLDFSIEKIDEIARNIVSENISQKTEDTRECKYCPMKYYCHRYW